MLAWNAVLGINTGASTCDAPYSTPLLSGGMVFVGTGIYSSVYAIHAQTGTVLWSTSVSGSVFAAPVVINGMLLQGSWAYGVSSLYSYKLPASLTVG